MHLIRLLRPSLISARRKYSAQHKGIKRIIAPCALLLFTILLGCCVFDGLTILHTKLFIVSLPLFLWLLPLGAVFFFLFFSTAVVHTTTSFYLSEDLPLLLASPLNYRSIFFLKLSAVYTLSFSIAATVTVPPLIALGLFYHVAAPFYLMMFLALIPLSIIATGLAATLVIVVTSFLPAKRAREIFLIGVTFLLLGMYLLVKFSQQGSFTTMRTNTLLSSTHLLFDPYMPWYWFATIGSSFAPTSTLLGIDIPIIALSLLAVTLLSCAYLTSLLLYERGLIRTSQYSARGIQKKGVPSRFLKRLRRLALMILPAYLLGMFKKEMTVLVRDMAQAVQLFLILGVCLIYLYNVRIFSSIEADPTVSLWWRGTLLIITYGMSALVLIALTSRFIFPSVSLEGKVVWLLQTSPLTTLQWLRAKQLSWWIPSSCIAVVLFCSGGFAIDLHFSLIIILSLLGIVTSYGLAALGVGLGAVYAEFSWENHSQIASSFGNFIFIVSSFLWIGLLSIILFLGVMVVILWEINLFPDELSAELALGSLSLLFLWLNLWIGRFTLLLGATHLNARSRTQAGNL